MSGRGRPVTYSVCFYDLPGPELVEAAVLAEQLGFDICWLGEHLFLPTAYRSVHPTRDEGTERRAPIIDGRTELLDPFVMAGAVAAATTRLRFGTAVYLATLRHPLLGARAAATAWTLSGGRFLLGVGAGWLREEFDVLGVPFERRGALLDEAIDLFRRAWAGGPFTHRGAHWELPEVQVCPEPLAVPLVTGGNSDAALRRAGRLADGWINSGAAAPEQLARARDAIEAERRAAGRSGRPFTYWARPPALDPELSDQLAAEGFDQQVIWGHQLWPAGAGHDREEKRHTMITTAATFGLGHAPAPVPS